MADNFVGVVEAIKYCLHAVRTAFRAVVQDMVSAL